MKTAPIRPARIAFDAHGVPGAPDFGDVYHARAGALAQCRHVFLQGNGLPARWQGRDDFVVLETGFGLGNNFLATWAAWRADPQRSRRLTFISVEKHPLTAEDLARVHRDHAHPELCAELRARWPALTPNLHTLDLDDGRVTLLLAFGDATVLLRHLVARVDAFFLDGFSPAVNPQMWTPPLLAAVGRLAAPGATAATWSAARQVRDGLRAAGFQVSAVPGFAGKRDMTVARFAPAFTPRGTPALDWEALARRPREALVVGAGLAGCATVHALASHGWHCTLVDRHDGPAREASGNAGGLFHGVVNAHDGAHARFNRAAALDLVPVLADLRRRHRIAGESGGLLRLEAAPVEQMAAMVAALGLPQDYVHALDARQAASLAGLPLSQSAWFYPRGGWLAPPDYAAALLAEAGDRVQWRGGREVATLRATGDDPGQPVWQALDPDGGLIAQAPVVVLANSLGALPLAGLPPALAAAIRGQTTLVPADSPGLPLARLPVAGAGYVLPPHEGWVLCGATHHVDDPEPGLRDADHTHNLAQLARLTGHAVAPASCHGRVGWRCSTPDRLPLIGAVPDLARIQASPGLRLDQPRLLPRQPGLYVFSGLGSRGIAWAHLGARLLSHWIDGAPCPVEADLRDAVDVARHLSKAARRAGAPLQEP